MKVAVPTAVVWPSLRSQCWVPSPHSSCPTGRPMEEGAGSAPGTKSCISSCVLLPLRDPETAGSNQTQPSSESSPSHPSAARAHPLPP